MTSKRSSTEAEIAGLRMEWPSNEEEALVTETFVTHRLVVHDRNGGMPSFHSSEP